VTLRRKFTSKVDFPFSSRPIRHRRKTIQIMAQDAPPLVLSDIVHGMSPSPAPQAMDTTSNEVTRRSVSPEVLAEEQVAAMRQRVLELGPIPEAGQDAHSRERELVDMVRRLRLCKAEMAVGITLKRLIIPSNHIIGPEAIYLWIGPSSSLLYR
jgi:hypothetical protein